MRNYCASQYTGKKLIQSSTWQWAAQFVFSCTGSTRQVGMRGDLLQLLVQQNPHVEFCKGAMQSGLVSVWQHTLVSQQWQGFL